MRVFVGMMVPKEGQAALDKLAVDKHDAKLHHPDDRHMTLFFLGEVTEPQIQQLIEDIEALESFSPVEWIGKRVGPFPSKEHPKVYALEGEVTPDLDGLRSKLSKLPIMSGLVGAQLGQFRPHVSLSRSNKRRVITEVDGVQIRFDSFGIYQSQQRPLAEPRYKVIKEWRME